MPEPAQEAPEGAREEHPDRWLVVGGRRWRRQDPDLPDEVAQRLLSHLGRGRSGVRSASAAGKDPAPSRRRVDLAKHGLGERGTPWWEQDAGRRRTRWEEALTDLDALDD
jgi:hypothetical protein